MPPSLEICDFRAQIPDCIYNLPVITYDETKRKVNIGNHGFDFIGSESVIAGFTITRVDERDAYGELRLQMLGLFNGVVIFIVHTPRGDADHIIQAKRQKSRKA